jgi:hypothetical protein
MGLTEDGGEALLSFVNSGAPLAQFPMSAFTPGNGALSDTNFAETLRDAAAAAQAAGGGVVLIPPGTWSPGDVEFVFASAGRNSPLYIQGAGIGITTILVPVEYTGTLFKLSGMPDDGAEDLFYDGGMSNLTISCEEEDEDTTGTAIQLAACIQTQFSNIVIRNFTGGTGFHASYDALNADFTNQYVQLRNFVVTSCDINYHLDAFINCQGYGVDSLSSVTHDFLIPNAKVAFYGGNIQSSAAVCVSLAGRGGSQIVFHDFYYEGTPGTLFSLPAPSDVSNQVAIYNMHVGGAATIFADVGAFNDLTIVSATGISNSTKILKARDGANCLLIECSDPIALSAKFDLDAASAAQLICISNGAVYSSKHKLSEIAIGSVGSGPVMFVDIADHLLKFKNNADAVFTVDVTPA